MHVLHIHTKYLATKKKKRRKRKRGKLFISGEVLRVLHIHTKYLATKKKKFSFLLSFGLSPSTMYGNRLKVSESSPRLINHCLNSCQKKLDISQVQNKWMRVSLSFLQKVHCSLSLRLFWSEKCWLLVFCVVA